MTDGLPNQSILTLCWSNHRSTFPTTLSTFRRKELYCDVSLACSGRFYGAHKLVLSACSDYFEAIFQQTDCKHPVIVLKDIVPEDLEALLCYMYEGVATVTKQNLNRLIKSAEDLRIKGLALADMAFCSAQERYTTVPVVATSATKTTRDGRGTPPSKKQRKDASNVANSSTTQDFQQQQTVGYTTAKAGDQFSQRGRTRNEQNHANNKETAKTETFTDEETEIKTEENSLPKAETLMTTYGLVVSDGTVNHTIVQQAHNDVTQRYETTQVPASSHSQPLADAVAEALAGTTGIGTWLAPADLGSGNFTTMQAYNTETGEVATATPIEMETTPTVTVLSNATSADATQGVQNTTPIQVVTSVPSVPTTSSETGRPESLKCHYCHRDTFRQMSDLKRHIRIHTGEKPFKCTVCPYKASRRDLLQAHLSKMHPNS